MTDDLRSNLRQDTRNLFYHGYNNYLAHAFPEDELKPITCGPQTRNVENPADIGLNDVLGNYSLTLIDSLSTLAILASGQSQDGRNSLQDFQRGVEALVDLYGDGKDGSCGSRACGFDLDSKVQVFETNIRGVGGLLSAHLFAVGELPIRGYKPAWTDAKGRSRGVQWNGFVYDGQLLRLAKDLAERLLPAFSTATDLPYPRVNLRYGIPFYQDAEAGFCRLDGSSSDPREITETCAAGAGSLVLEFATLSRLTGDTRFEDLAKKAFWAVWGRRSAIGLLAAGIDAENGHWIMPPLSGIGAGIDSFFEYSLKSHILLSNLALSNGTAQDEAASSFLTAWQQAHSAVKHHVYRTGQAEKHPFYGQADFVNGAPRFSWIDNLSAYYPGLLTLAGELDEAIESHLLYAALWTRYSAIPERWHAPNAYIDPNFKHWAGRPEFIESTYYLFQATKDPWYLHVGEMALRDIRRRCWTNCGWADLGDVVSGEQRDRMESFFLGETAKYLYLLFDPGHPLNKMDAAVVFTTEGHPLVIPRTASAHPIRRVRQTEEQPCAPQPTCPAPSPPLALTISNIANRHDLFHAAALAQLHLVPVHPARSSPIMEPSSDSAGISLADVRSPSNYTFYPWTLPQSLIPSNGMSSLIAHPLISTLTFPDLSPTANEADFVSRPTGMIALGALHKLVDGVLINSLSNMRLNLVQDSLSFDGNMQFRIQAIANWALGRDEKVLVSAEAVQAVSPADPHFTRVKDLERIDLCIDVPVARSAETDTITQGPMDNEQATLHEGGVTGNFDALLAGLEGLVHDLLLDSADGTTAPKQTREAAARSTSQATPTYSRVTMPAILPTGAGAAPLPETMDNMDLATFRSGQLPSQSIFFLNDTLCRGPLPSFIAEIYSILILKRGECSFAEKLASIPPLTPSRDALQLVVVLSTPEQQSEPELDRNAEARLIRPLLEGVQKTPSGLERRHPIAMCMVDGGAQTVDALRRVSASSGYFDGRGKFIEQKLQYAQEKAGFGVKRRYWFESMGIVIGNLVVL